MDAVVFRGSKDAKVAGLIQASSSAIAGGLRYTNGTSDQATNIQLLIKYAAKAYTSLLLYFRKSYTDLKNAIIVLQKSFTTNAKHIYKKSWFFITGKPLLKENNTTHLFLSNVIFSNVDFRRPDRTHFISVDLSQAEILGTDFRGVQFYDVNWFISGLGRNGIYDEIKLKQSNDLELIHFMQRQLEEAYRITRLSLEVNKDYNTASDFYIGEMDLKRQSMNSLRRYFLSVEAWYETLSTYGTSPKQAIKLFAYLCLLHISICTYLLTNDFTFQNIIGTTAHSNPLNPFLWTKFNIHITHTLQVFTLQKVNLASTFDTNAIKLTDAIFRIISPIQIAITALSFRSRIKRH
jgi:hypothetical protein